MPTDSRPVPPRRPARPTRATYVRRRIVAALVVVSVVVVAATGVRSLLGGGGSPDAAAEDSTTTAAVNATVNAAAPATVPATDAAATTTSTTSPDHADDWVPTAAEPAVIYIAGDSDAGTFGPYLEDLMDDTGVTRTVLDYKVSSGLSRPDFFDWPARFTAELPAVNPDIVVVTFGGNDAQGLSQPDGTFIAGQPTGDTERDTEWRAEYGRRVGAVMDQLTEGGRTLVWVGIPNDDDPDVTARMGVQDSVVKAEAAKRPDVILIDTWGRFSGRNGGWAEYIIDPRDGQGKDVRAPDGFHLNETGAEILALDIAEALRGVLRELGAPI